MSQRINLKGIASYPHLFVARAPGRPGQQQGDPKYSVNIILDDDNDWATINAMLAAEQKEGFPNGWPNNGHWPLQQYTEQDAPKPEFVGKWWVNAKSAERPPVVDHQVLPITDESQIYPGCRIVAAVAFASFNNVLRGIGCYLNAVQKIGDGPRLDDRPSVNQVFTAMAQQNVPGFDPAAFPQGTPQNPGPGAAPGAPQQTFGVPGQDPRAYQQAPGGQAPGGNGAAAPQGVPQGQAPGTGGTLPPGVYPFQPGPQGGGQ